MNYMAEVAKMLGVELGEEFGIYKVNGHYVLFDDGLVHIETGNIVNGTLNALLLGQLTINYRRWKPKFGEEYYSIGVGGVLEPGTWLNDFIDVAMYKLGNCYETMKEAEANRDKWITFYALDEILEV